MIIDLHFRLLKYHTPAQWLEQWRGRCSKLLAHIPHQYLDFTLPRMSFSVPTLYYNITGLQITQYARELNPR